MYGALPYLHTEERLPPLTSLPPTHQGEWVTPGEAAVCHSASVRRLLSTALAAASSNTSAAEGGGGEGRTTPPPARSDGGKASATALLATGGSSLHLVHPAARALHENAALRACLGVREFSPMQLVSLARVRESGEAAGVGCLP